MSDPIGKIKGTTPELVAKFESLGIHDSDTLLAQSKTYSQRSELAHKAGITVSDLKNLANRADLMRLKGVGGDLSNLLEEAGVNSCKELQHRVAEHLHKTLVDLRTSQHIAHHVPPVAHVQDWINQAKVLSQSSLDE